SRGAAGHRRRAGCLPNAPAAHGRPAAVLARQPDKPLARIIHSRGRKRHPTESKAFAVNTLLAAGGSRGRDSLRSSRSLLGSLATPDQAARRYVTLTTSPPALASAGDESLAYLSAGNLRASSAGNGPPPRAAPYGRERPRPGGCRRGSTPGTSPCP